MIRRKILIERSAQGRIENLNAAANTQKRLVSGLGALDHQPLQGIALRTNFAAQGRLLLTVDRWIHILAAREREHLVAVERTHRQRQHDRHAARLFHGLQVF